MKDEVIKQLKAYEELMLKKRSIENELEAMKEDLIPQLPVATNIETENGIFTVESRTTWKYSKETKKLKEDLKDAEKLEQRDGTAKAEAGKPFLVYREGKEV